MRAPSSRLRAALSVLAAASGLSAQTEPVTGIRERPPRVHALTDARIVTEPGQVIERGTVVIRDGLIEAVGAGVAVPADARVWDCAGLEIRAGLIEAWLHDAEPPAPRRRRRGADDHDHDHAGHSDAPVQGRAEPAPAGGRHWNPRIHPERRTADAWRPEPDQLDELRRLGFCAALVVPARGILGGSSSLVSLGDGPKNRRFVREDVFQHATFQRARGRSQYPNSLMGAIALLRQTFFDARWHRDAHAAYAKNARQERPEHNAALAALAPVLDRKTPLFIEVADDLDLLRALKLGAELELDLRVKGSGYEYRRLEAAKQVPLIVPVTFPEPPAVDTPEQALDVTLRELRAWDRAPENPARLHRKGVRFCLTSAGLKQRSKFHDRVREAVERGLPPGAALRALTVAPAELLGVADRLGTIAEGKIANLVVTDGPLFADGTKVRETWIDGTRYPAEGRREVDPRGVWSVRVAGGYAIEVMVSGEPERLTARFEINGEKHRAERVRADGRSVAVTLDGKLLGTDGVVRMTGTVTRDAIAGSGVRPDGSGFRWSAKRQPFVLPDVRRPLEAGPAPELACETPEGAYGTFHLPEQRDVLIRGATLWTCAERGKIVADLYVKGGKIAEIGKDLGLREGAVIIDGKGKHVTPGLIDPHSHTAISRGVNESTQAVTAEVRIQDVVNSDDVNIYRQLAGGCTVANLLHGSANPIGGQMWVVKWRWGADPDGLAFEGALPGIKFALGENVKHSNRGPEFTTRYPQTRMGIEQILRDRFHAAREYTKAWQEHEIANGGDRIPPRRDLELKALAEILAGERAIHCHSYRQDEILMLIRVAGDFGFTVGTFQHVLEGYKIAEAIKAHGAMASSFSDWWAYKYEVIDAIPHNGAILHQVGVVTSFNSDSSELARRLNTEAAKAVKYGGVPEQEALCFVTLYAAKQLGIDDRVGSLEVGKDGDFVIWNGHPLSSYSRCEQTWVEGRTFFDTQLDTAARLAVASEHAQLVQKVLQAAEEKKKRRRKEALDRLGDDSNEEVRR